MRFPRPPVRKAVFLFALVFISTGFLVSQTALAEQPEHLIQLNQVDYNIPVRVIQNSPVTLSNNWGVALHQTTITQIDSGASLASIQKVMAGQTVSLEFPREGAYSICYFLTPKKQPDEERCFFLNVVPFKTA